MTQARTRIGIVVERRRLQSPWADAAWLPVQALPAEPATPAWTELGSTEKATRFYAGGADLELYRTETAHYRDNLGGGRPSLWVLLRPSIGTPPVELVAVTADPAEGESFTQAGDDIVEPVPMPEAIVTWVAAFVAEHHVDRAFFKRRRDRADPDSMGRRTRVDDDDG